MDVIDTRIPFRKGAEPHRIIIAYNRPRGFRCEISESPTGRSIQVYINDIKVYPPTAQVDR
jgi:hypothetical protein